MHDLVEGHEKIRAFDETLAGLAAAEKEAVAAAREEAEGYRKALEYAALNGAELPPAPTRNPGSISIEFLTRQQVLAEQRQRALYDAAPEVMELMVDREAELLAEAKVLTARFDEIAAELGELVRTSRNISLEVRRGERPLFEGNVVEPGLLLLAARHGWRFVDEPVAVEPSVFGRR